MRIGIDATAALVQSGGIGRYSRELIQAIVAAGRQHAYTLFYAAGALDPAHSYLPELERLRAGYEQVRLVPIPLSPRRLTQLWQRLRAPLPVELATGRLDIVHAPDFVLPPTFARTLQTVHDLSFLTHPELTVPSMVRYLSAAVPRSARRADRVLADSQATKDDMVRLMGTPAEKITVVYPGLNPAFQILPAEQTAAVRARLGLPERFLVFVSTLSPRKNVVRLIEAFRLLAQTAAIPPDLSLLLIGQRGWMDDEIFAAIEQAGLGERLRWLRFIDDQDLPAVYNLAQATVYPSLYEGFGLPVLEALACGTPVVTATNSSLPEAAGDAAVLVEATSVEQIAEGIARVLNDQPLRERLRAAGFAHIRGFRWETAAHQVLEQYQRLG